MPSTVDFSHSPSLSGLGLELDPLIELKEVMESPTPLSEMLQDPGIIRSLIGQKKSRRPSTGSQRSSNDRERARDSRKSKKDSDTTSILTLVLAEEERQAHHLKAVLRTTSDRLEAEIRRADQAEERARTADMRTRDASTRASLAEQAKHQAEIDATRAKEEITRHRMVAETAEREARRLDADMQRLERLRNEAEQSAVDARDAARKAQQTLREWQAREEGRLEGMRLEVRRRYEDGREDGFEDGRAEGYEAGRAEGYEEGKADGFHAGRTEGMAAGRLGAFEEGRQAGYDDGFKEGYERGRKEERVHALEAFDKFMDKEREMDQDERSITTIDGKDRIHRWVEDIRPVPPPEFRISRPSSPKYIRSPSPRPIPEPAPLPVPVWLHRQPRAPTPGPFIRVQSLASDES